MSSWGLAMTWIGEFDVLNKKMNGAKYSLPGRYLTDHFYFPIIPQLLRSGETSSTFLEFPLESLSGSIPPAWRCLGKRLKERGWGHMHCTKEVLQTSLCVYCCGPGEKSLYWKRVSESIWIHLVSIFIS